MPIDSIYTPVLKVNYTVDNTRVGQITDYDKLTLDVWTNGVINAQEAVSLAAKVLTEHLNLFVNLSDKASSAEVMVEKDDKGKEKILEMTIEDLDLSVRSFNCLKRAGINTVEDLINKSEEDMMKCVTSVENLSRKLYRSSILSVLSSEGRRITSQSLDRLFCQILTNKLNGKGVKEMPGTRKLGRTTAQRTAMLRAMVTFLLENGKIETTLTRAKEVQAMAEKMITTAKEDTLHNRTPCFGFCYLRKMLQASFFKEIASKIQR